MKKYIAYGSNINVEWMKETCPGSELLGSGYILNAKLLFRGKGYLNLVLGPGYGKVPVSIWNISEENERALDNYEEYPSYYVKKNILVLGDKGIEEGMVYVMTDEFKDIKKAPEDFYVKRVLDGFEQMSYDKKPVEDALEEICK
ncbi:gamma-glutamylcyclotransferase family protein [Peptoniphilus sp. BV3C26]|uniref:gamma-glutamylcyclotransferase family protein n=1 Tax=Peptoniphilus sp. BV3C26 TaxID=1111134 RepID=UPI0003B90CBC|nr:gamma-glutamylcyclotransferase family protein [Peptoniphilus sp. BV3C26]ERT59069.1 AIG2-like family protein [Peptoniphilus sp. BV3C26]